MTDINTYLKVWERYHSLAQNFDNNCWKIRTTFIGFSTAVISYGFTSSTPDLYIAAAALSLLFFLFESGYRRLQMQYYEKIREIEVSINDILSEESEPRLPDSGINSQLNTPDIDSLFALLSLKRIMFWLPYLLFFAIPLFMYFVGIVKII